MMLMPSHSARVTFGYIKLNLPIGFQISKAGEVFSACSYEHSLFAKKIGTQNARACYCLCCKQQTHTIELHGVTRIYVL